MMVQHDHFFSMRSEFRTTTNYPLLMNKETIRKNRLNVVSLNHRFGLKPKSFRTLKTESIIQMYPKTNPFTERPFVNQEKFLSLQNSLDSLFIERTMFDIKIFPAIDQT
jgi:hypothetical protein